VRLFIFMLFSLLTVAQSMSRCIYEQGKKKAGVAL